MRKWMRRIQWHIRCYVYGWDYIIGVCFCIITGIIAMNVYQHSDDFALLSVRIQNNEGQYLYSLYENRALQFTGPIGITVVHIENESVFVIRDPGPQQICVKKGRITQRGQWLLCLPNQIFITIESQENGTEAIDGMAIDALAF